MNQAVPSTLLKVAFATSLVLLLSSPLGAQRVSDRKEVRPDEMAELAVVSLKPATLYPLPGETVDVTIQVHNRATRSEREVTIALFAGHDRVASGTIDIEAGETVYFHLAWKPAEEGHVTLTARIDPDQKLVEHDRHDNALSEDIVVAHKPHVGTDLAISKLEIIKSPLHPTVLHALVRNNGTSAVATPLILKADDRTVGVQLVRIAARATMTVDVPLPSTSLAAKLSAEINPRHRSDERVSNDNVLFVDLRPPADLLVNNLSVYNPRFERGPARQLTISFRVVNIGSRPITRAFRAAVFPQTTSPRILQLGVYSVNINGLPAGGTVYISQTIVTTVNAVDVRVQADADNVVPEPNEENNIAVSRYRIPDSDTGRWVSIGPSFIDTRLSNNQVLNAVGRLSAIAIHPTAPATIYVGALGSGVWKTTNGGTPDSWRPVTDSLPTLSIAAIAIDPSSPARVYVATPRVGVFRSEDAGMSWSQISEDLNAEVDWGLLLVHPTNPNVIYLTSADGLRRSSDFGETWPVVLPVPSGSPTGGGTMLSTVKSKQATDLVMDPSNPNILYAAIFGDGIYKTINGGNTWNKLAGNLPTTDIQQVTLALCRDVPTTLYAGYSRSFGLELYRKTDADQSWELRPKLLRPLGANHRALNNPAIGVDPTNPQYVYITGVDFYYSSDGGASFDWAPSEQYGPHVDHHAFANDPVNPGMIYALSDGGIFRSSNRGVSWSFIGDGIANVEFYDLAASVLPPNISVGPLLVIGGTQDNGTLRYTGPTSWKRIKDGDGGFVDIDPTNPQKLYAMNQYINSLDRSTDGGNSFIPFRGGLPTTNICGPPSNGYWQINPADPASLLASCQNFLWKTVWLPPFPNAPALWVPIYTLSPSSASVVRSAVDPSTNLYYAGTTDGRLFAGPGGVNFQLVFTHPSGNAVTDIDVDPNDPSAVYVSFAGKGGRIYRLKRSMTIEPTAIDAGLGPDTSVIQTLAVNRRMPFTIFAGTNSQGVYRGRSLDGGATWLWEPFNDGLPAGTNVTDLEVHPITGVMRAATYGRSAFEVNTYFSPLR